MSHLPVTGKLALHCFAIGWLCLPVAVFGGVDDELAQAAKSTNLHDIDDNHPSNEDYPRYLLPELKKIAARPDGEMKHWLKRFLGNCGNTAERRELQGLVTKGLPQ